MTERILGALCCKNHFFIVVMRLAVPFALLLATAVWASELNALFEQMVYKRDKVKQNNLQSTIMRSVPYGLDKLQPAIAEYETFRQNPTNNFIHDGRGNIVFRQFRRLSMSDVLSRQHRNPYN